MATQTATVDFINDSLPTLALGLSEGTYVLNRGAQRPSPKVQMIADVEWLYARISGGPYTLVPAKTPAEIPLIGAATTFYAKAVSVTGTLYGVISE